MALLAAQPTLNRLSLPQVASLVAAYAPETHPEVAAICCAIFAGCYENYGRYRELASLYFRKDIATLELSYVYQAPATYSHHARHSQTMMLQGLRQVMSLPAVHILILGGGSTEPYAVFASVPQVQRITVVNYDLTDLQQQIVALPDRLQSKIRLVQADLTGGLFRGANLLLAQYQTQSQAYEGLTQFFQNLPQPSWDPLEPAHFAISCCVMGQLTSNLSQYTQERIDSLTDDSPSTTLKQGYEKVSLAADAVIQERHIGHLRTLVAPQGCAMFADTVSATTQFPLPTGLEQNFTILTRMSWPYGLVGTVANPTSFSQTVQANTSAFLLRPKVSIS